MKLRVFLFGLLAQGHARTALGLDHLVNSIVKRQGDEDPVGTLDVQLRFVDTETCQGRRDILKEEFQYAHDMVSITAGNVQQGPFYEHFFDQGSRDDPGFVGKVNQVFGRIRDMLTGRDPEFVFNVSCDNTSQMCRKGMLAHQNPETYGMNFCDRYFVDTAPPGGDEGKVIKPTKDMLGKNPKPNLRDVHRTRAAIIIHETTHTTHAMWPFGQAEACKDYAYGYNACAKLAEGTFDRSCEVYNTPRNQLCKQPDGSHVCPADYSTRNADSYAFIAAGIFFSQRLSYTVPFPESPNPGTTSGDDNTLIPDDGATATESTKEPAPNTIDVTPSAGMLHPVITPLPGNTTGNITGNTTLPGDIAPRQRRSQWTGPGKVFRKVEKTKRKRAIGPRGIVDSLAERQAEDICPYNDDYIIIDGPEDNIDITGYVHFGDSYASGMGTGETSTDHCRVGSNNYGGLIHDWIRDGNDDIAINYQRVSCSGDTMDGLIHQIEEWNNMDDATIGTVTIGGNDLGFTDLVQYCVITPNTLHWGSTNRKYCAEAEKKAKEGLLDLKGKLIDAYQMILDKSGRRDFHLYVAGYPTFFNEDTSDCNKASFHYWWGGNRPSSDWPANRIIYLTNNLRTELDDIVRSLNSITEDAVEEVNQKHGGNQVHYVSVDERFAEGSHRWCEEDARDPDQDREDTFFFLSAWPDVDIDVSTAELEAAEVEALMDGGEIKLPDADNCRAELDKRRIEDGTVDPYEVAMCHVAEEVRDDPEGPRVKQLEAANKAIEDGDVESEDISWFAPTRQIKTFHPRSPGMALYRDAIIEAIQEGGAL